MKEHVKKAAAVGTGGTLAFLSYQCMELSKQNYDLAQRVAKLEVRAEYHHGAPAPEEEQAEEAASAAVK